MRTLTRVFAICIAALAAAGAQAEEVRIRGLEKPVEILRDRWGVPHIYAQNAHDLFFAQGYMAARDRLWQIDLWRRIGTGKLSEVLGPSALERDRLARAVRFRGDMEAEWRSYSPDTKAIATSFTNGINAYIRSLNGARPPEFARAGYDPGLWVPEDCLARVAGLLMTRNLAREVARAVDIQKFGLETVQKFLPPDPNVRIEIPRGLDIKDINRDILRVYEQTIGPVRFLEDQGSNNWVIDGTMSATGKPLLANDPHRPVIIPSLRKTVHLVAPGWNVIGAGEPALPGVALGHNERIGFGFTIVGIDQSDLYVERLNPKNPEEYLYRGEWRKVESERESIPVKGEKPRTVELRYTIHGPIIHEDRARNRAYALKWVGTEPGTAGYLAGIALARANNWKEFAAAVERYHVPSENLVYADVDGNIGWHASGLTPVRKNWTGLLPVPGHTGEYEWSGFRRASELPRKYNPPERYIATANHNILPPGYTIPLSYEWALPFRFERVRELLGEKKKFTVQDFERMQHDVVSIPARRFQAILKRWNPGKHAGLVQEMLRWNASLDVDSMPALIYEVWVSKLPRHVFPGELGARTDLQMLLRTLEREPHAKALGTALEEALQEIQRELGVDRKGWQWGRLHTITFRHPVMGDAAPPVRRPGDGNTVNSTSGTNFKQTSGASFRQILDVSDWDKSVMTTVPGESGDPRSRHYTDLLENWAAGRYHPMVYSRKAVEAATVERITLMP